VRCTLFNRYYFDIALEEFSRVGKVIVHHDSLEFPEASEKKVINKVLPLLEEGLTFHLTHQLYQKAAFYIREELDIPLVGSTEIGVVDRGSNIIEIKPLTGCNFTCTYCSVDEGKNSKSYDYLVESDYLVTVAEQVARGKTGVEFNIGPHGEPLLYPEMVELIRGLKAIPNCEIISINTNGALLSEKLIDEMVAAGLTRINLSIPALDQELATELAGVAKFPLEHLLTMIEYAKEKVAILLAPVLIPGKNEGEMGKIVELSKSIKSDYPTIGIQNYLEYPKGRKAVKKQLPWEHFYALIAELETTSGKRLKSTLDDFKIHEEKTLKKPFKKDQVVSCTICMPGRYPNEMYAKAEGRLINVQEKNEIKQIGKQLKVRIVRDKHNIFKGVPLKQEKI
jgi:uncharacterized Fe-S cluster-containing radical SAM superfamily enzyme